MKLTIEEFVISGENLSKEHGNIYECIGLDVIYDSHCIKIYSSSKAKIKSLSNGIHIHCVYSSFSNLIKSGYASKNDNQTTLELEDKLGNMIYVTFIGDRPFNSIAIITSGGDAPGMNAAIKSIIRSSINCGTNVYGVYRGYDGLVNDYLCKMGWDTETHSSGEGGTVLLSVRSKNFFKRETRKLAAYNLIKRGINCLVVLGGDGSLKGALQLKRDFKIFFKELIEEGKLTTNDLKLSLGLSNNLRKNSSEVNEIDYYEEFYGAPECFKEIPKINVSRFSPLCEEEKISDENKLNKGNVEDKRIQESSAFNSDNFIYDLKIIGIPASIDNDIWGSDITLGADTAMNRVIESIDHLSSTMRSHQRIFVIEVMGRTCGWIALMSAFSCIADFVFIPEDPPENWKIEIMENINFAKQHGKPGIFILISEGAIDKEGVRIESGDVVKHISSFDIDVRLLKLGHVQRGGPTSAFDRILGILSGIKAVEVITESIDNDSKIICYTEGIVKSIDLEEVIRKNDEIKEFEKNFKFTDILESRGKFFNEIHKSYKVLVTGKNKISAPLMEDIKLKFLFEANVQLKNKYKVANESIERELKKKRTKLGILQCGSRSSGMNTALNAIIHYCFVKGIDPHYILNGFDGIKQNQIIKAKLYEFSADYNNGGASLGLSSLDNIDVKKVEETLIKQDITSLVIIGDSDTLDIINGFTRINVILVPSSANNNIPCTDSSIGSDTALNTILKVSDCAKLSSFSMKRNVFVLEVAGGNCGYLTLMGGIAAGAFDCFIPERKYLISHLSETAHRLRLRFKESKRNGIVIFRNERTFCSISTESFCRVLKTDGKGLFETDYSVMGRLQQGLYPSAIDRINATLFSIKSVDACLENLGRGCIGLTGNEVRFYSIKECLEGYDKFTKTVKNPKWVKYNNICKSIE